MQANKGIPHYQQRKPRHHQKLRGRRNVSPRAATDSEFSQVVWDMELPEFTENKYIVFGHQACGDLL